MVDNTEPWDKLYCSRAVLKFSDHMASSSCVLRHPGMGVRSRRIGYHISQGAGERLCATATSSIG